MNNENFARLNELAFSREHRRPFNVDTPRTTIDNEARRSLWITASILLTDEQAEYMIKTLEEAIVLDAIYYANKEKMDA